MNKAFVKEQDSDSGHCPRCHALGVPVGADTLDSQLTREQRRELADTASFCTYARCPVVYFDAFERVIEIEAFGRPVYPKDAEAPICSCFGLTMDDIDDDVAEGTPTRTRRALELAKGPDARCATKAPSGKSCVGDIQRCYLQRRGAG